MQRQPRVDIRELKDELHRRCLDIDGLKVAQRRQVIIFENIQDQLKTEKQEIGLAQQVLKNHIPDPNAHDNTKNSNEAAVD